MTGSRVMTRKRPPRLPWRVIYISLAVMMGLLPLIWTVLASFGVTVNNSSPPKWSGTPNFEHFREAVLSKPAFVSALLNSAGVAALNTLVATFTAFLAAYALARSRFLARDLLVQGLLVLAGLPVIAYLMPLRATLTALHLYDTLIGTALAGGALFAPLATYVLYGFMRHMPLEPEQAAQLEGANPLQVLWKVIWPISRPSVVATAIVVFVLAWNQFLLPIASTFQLKTVPVMIIDFFTFERESDWPSAAAALIAALVPVLLLVAVMHRWLEHFSLGGAHDESIS